jgi:hypothetical protein
LERNWFVMRKAVVFASFRSVRSLMVHPFLGSAVLPEQANMTWGAGTAARAMRSLKDSI